MTVHKVTKVTNNGALNNEPYMILVHFCVFYNIMFIWTTV